MYTVTVTYIEYSESGRPLAVRHQRTDYGFADDAQADAAFALTEPGVITVVWTNGNIPFVNAAALGA